MRNAVWILLASTVVIAFAAREVLQRPAVSRVESEAESLDALVDEPTKPSAFHPVLRSTGKALTIKQRLGAAEELALILQDARAAIGYSRLKGLKTGVVGNGSAQSGSLQTAAPVQYSFLFASGGRFIERLHGDLNAIFGYDGKTAWTLSWSRSPELESLNTSGAGQLAAWVRSGHWLASPAPFKLSLDLAQSDANRTAIRMQGAGFRGALLYLDRKTNLPKQLLVHSSEGVDRWQFEDYAVVEGVRVARRVEHDGAGNSSRFRMTELAISTRSAAELFEPLRFQAGRFKNLEPSSANAPS